MIFLIEFKPELFSAIINFNLNKFNKIKVSSGPYSHHETG